MRARRPWRDQAAARGQRATQLWHCQRLVARPAPSPPSIGTARDSWRGRLFRHWALALPEISGVCHPALALPAISGVERALATQGWHCQRLVARPAPSPPGIGTARDSWRTWRGRRARHAFAADVRAESADFPSQGRGMLYALENERSIGVLSWTSSKLSPTSWAFHRAMSRQRSSSSTAEAPCPSSRVIARRRRATWATSRCASLKSAWRIYAGLPRANKRC